MEEPSHVEQLIITEGADDLASEASFYSLQNMVRIAIALAALAGLTLARNIVAKTLTKPVALITHKVFPDHQVHFEEALKGPISFLCIAGGIFIAGNVLIIPPEFQDMINHAMQSVLDVLIFYVLYQAIDPISHVLYKTGTGFTDELREVIADFVKIVVVCIGLLTLLDAWGVNVGAFLAGLGLVGMAVALAAQDTMKNLFASVAMFADKSFKANDWILTPEVEGTVETVSLRTTTLRQFDTSTIRIPNANLANGTIVNFNNCTQRRITWSLPLTAPSNEKFQTVVDRLDKYVHDHPKVDKSGAIIVNLDEFGEACIKLFVYFMVNEVDWKPFMEIQQQILFDFLRIVEEEKCAFGVPTRLVRVQNV